MNEPFSITVGEWREIYKLPEIRELWGISDEWDFGPEEFATHCYGVRFDFVSGSPGYCGPLYLVHGDAITGYPPVMLTRIDGRLEVCEYDVVPR